MRPVSRLDPCLLFRNFRLTCIPLNLHILCAHNANWLFYRHTTRHTVNTRPTTTIFDLPAEIFTDEVAKYLDGDSKAAFALVSHFTNTLFQPLLYDKDKLPLLKQALDHAARGEWNDVDTLLQATPELLTYRGTIQHHGRYKLVNRTIWQVALMNDEGENVYEMFKRHFDRLPDGQNGLEELTRQVQEVFPDGEMKKHEGWKLDKALNLFNAVFDAIKNDETLNENDLDKMNHDTQKALKAFYDYVTPKPSDSFTKGLLFDIQLFQAVVKKYDDEFAELNWNQRIFYGVKVWDYLVRLLPTGYLRPLCQGLYYIVDKKEPLSVNGCKLRTDSGIGTGAAVLPLDKGLSFVFGRDFIRWVRCRRRVARIGELMSSKSNKQKEFYAAIGAATPTHGKS